MSTSVVRFSKNVLQVVIGLLMECLCQGVTCTLTLRFLKVNFQGGYESLVYMLYCMLSVEFCRDFN